MQSRTRTVLTSVAVLCLTIVFGTSPLLAEPSPAIGPLTVHPTNPRYFADPTGRAVYLTGSHTWSNLQDGETSAFNYTSYLGLLQANHHNFIRLWISESPQADAGLMPAPGFAGGAPWYKRASPLPYARTGPGNAADGLPKFSLNQFDQAYFDRLRSRVIAARDQGIYVGIMLFNFQTAWNANETLPDRNVWRYHPYNTTNNVSGVNGDPNGNGNGEETHTLQVAAVTQAQEAYVKKVIDTVNDLDNVMYEVSNGDTAGDPAWQFHIINIIKNYEAGKSKQHLVGMTGAEKLSNSLLITNPGEWTSFAAATYNSPTDHYASNPPATDGTRISILDTDHIGYSLFQNDAALTRGWVWKSFTRGHHPILMEDSTGFSGWAAGRSAMGHTQSYASRMNLAGMTPLNTLSSTNYCLASAGQEYLVYQPANGPFTVNVAGGAYVYEWFNSVTGTIAGTGTVGAVGGDQSFTPPFSGPAVLYLKASGATPPATPPVASPVGHWKLDDANGLIVADASGNGLTGALVNRPVWTSGWLGGGLSLNGTNDYVHIPNPGPLSPQKLTLSLWVNPSSFANANWNSTLANVGLHEWSDGYYGLAIDTAGKPVAMVNNGGGEGNAVYLKGSALTVGQWSHLAMTYDNATLKLYVDGVDAGHVSINRLRTTSSAPLMLGRRGDAAHYFKGILDEVQLYSQALSAADITALVGNAPLPTPSSPPAPSSLPEAGVSSLTGLSSLAGVSSLAAVTPLNGVAPLSVTLAAVTTYKASTSFSSVQGQGGWFYRDSLGRNMTYNSAAGYWQGAETYLRLWNSGGHPGTGADAVRRWVAPSAGTIQITGSASHGASTGGVTVSIRKGSTILWQQALTTSTSYNVTTTVTAGQAIDFHINRGGDGSINSDSTGFDPTITLTTDGTTPPPPSGGTSFKASTNFSGVQGQGGWYYRDSLGRSMTYNSAAGYWQGAETYLRLWNSGGHPGNAADAVRRWVAPSAGTVQITGNANVSGGGGGVAVSIRKGSTILWQQVLATGASTAYNVTTTVAAGEAIDFWINRGGGGNTNDSTGFDPTITYTTGGSPPPPPSGGGGSAIVSWNANTEADLSGYRVYYGTSSRNYPNSISVGKVTSATITGLTVGTTYYIAVKAVDTSGNLSGYSAEVTKRP